jgi:excisionase family DNA binding protein
MQQTTSATAKRTDKQPCPAGLPRLAYSLKEVAAMLGISYTSVHRLVQRGELRSSGGLRHKLIAAGELERFLLERS